MQFGPGVPAAGLPSFGGRAGSGPGRICELAAAGFGGPGWMWGGAVAGVVGFNFEK